MIEQGEIVKYLVWAVLVVAVFSCDHRGARPVGDSENLATAKGLIDYVSKAPMTRRLSEIPLRWHAKGADAIRSYFDPSNIDRAKESVINAVANLNLTQGLGFYHAGNVGGAFANTFESRREFEVNGIKGKFVELFFQAEKVSRFGKMEYRGDFKKAYDALQAAKASASWGAFVRKVRDDFTDAGFNGAGWDAISLDVMSKIQAARFKAEPDLFLTLVATPARSVIVEDAQATDANWGNGGDGHGKNMLGLLYMTHRQRFWYAFKKAKAKNFDATSAEDVAFMLKWLASYDGTTH